MKILSGKSRRASCSTVRIVGIQLCASGSMSITPSMAVSMPYNPKSDAASSRTALVRRGRRVNRELARLYPDARIELNFTTPFELLVAAILSARTTDRRVNEVTRVLFARYRAAAAYAAADRAELEQIIRPAGYYREKAKTLIALGQALCDRFGGEVPDTLEELVTLPGVGRKTAQGVIAAAFCQPVPA